ncbi:DUF6320 domain-containing protein [Chitinophaga japonensis]|uniref:Zinc ribbon protein n=1 Tax=Chitinophaga japonensis TaxID=104662 RepID=A0A562SPB1_CHIJA|nr:DUF6320 domain-containing protein [Chitinophaga japonensis]TWI82526.1 zinc ribbon protein [Chitinophaga japonensis]
MNICNNCGVELEDDMQYCPLCGEPVAGVGNEKRPAIPEREIFDYPGKMTPPQKKFTWEIISIILLSGTVATSIIDFIITRGVSWSEYPVAISVTIFFYISLFAFWEQRTVMQMAGGLILSACFLVGIDALTGGIGWSVQLGIPLLFAANVVVAGLLAVIRRSKHKGINLIAWAFLAAALLCIGIEGILSFAATGAFHFGWSIIAAGCVVPVVLALLFVHFRLRKGRSLQKTFHI